MPVYGDYFIADHKHIISKWNWEEVLPSFLPGELLSPELAQKQMYHAIDLDSALKLQRFRDRVHQSMGVGLRVNFGTFRHRGVRTHNDQVQINKLYPGSAETFSMHCCGKAWDVSLPEGKSGEADYEQLYQLAVEFCWHGIGRYNSFLHIDNRDIELTGKVAQWNFTK